MLGNNFTILNKKIKILKIDINRRYLVLFTCAIFTFAWLSYALLQSRILKLDSIGLDKLTKSLELIALIGCLLFVISGITLAFYIDKENFKLYGQPKKPSNISSKSEKLSYYLEKHANKVDLFGSCINGTMQLVVILSMFSIIKDISQYPKKTAFNIQGIVDTIGNILFVLSTIMFIAAYLIKRHNEPNNEENQELLQKNISNNKKSLINKDFIALSIISTGAILILTGKILLSLEVRNNISYTGKIGPLNMDEFPAALIVRLIGEVLFVTGFLILLSAKKDELKTLELEKAEVENVRSKVNKV